MDRRFLTVLGVSLVFALVVSSIFYQMTSGASGTKPKNTPVETRDIVMAVKPLGVGVAIKPDDIKVAKIPESAFPKGAFSKPEEVIDRPVMSNILADEPVLEGRLAARGAGAGITPVIPIGMRAVTVHVNEVVGVAGFVLPGLHVDVLVTGRPPNGEHNTMTVTTLQDITVLSAGQTVQVDPRGGAINAPSVTLLVTPEQAEMLTLAGNEAKIQLVLRSSADRTIASTRGKRLSELYRTRPGSSGGSGWAPGGDGVSGDGPADMPQPVKQPVAEAPPLPPPPPAAPPEQLDQIVVIRGNQKTVETINPQGGRN
ncbi:MAG: Flp pilus assembly protein CpaB [Bryobacteraceae bacterium]